LVLHAAGRGIFSCSSSTDLFFVKQSPILFSAPMVRAILAGNKTQTRRLVKPQPAADFVPQIGEYYRALVDEVSGEQSPEAFARFGASDENEDFPCPFGRPGDVLWVREAYAPCSEKENHVHAKSGFTYRADWSQEEEESARDFLWKPSIFCTRAASRITLVVEGVRMERLQSITEEDAVAEGVDIGCPDHEADQPLPSMLYERLWEQINGPGTWADNPWVWVITFKRQAGVELVACPQNSVKAL
jgi:hypothetical protein